MSRQLTFSMNSTEHVYLTQKKPQGLLDEEIFSVAIGSPFCFLIWVLREDLKLIATP